MKTKRIYILAALLAICILAASCAAAPVQTQQLPPAENNASGAVTNSTLTTVTVAGESNMKVAPDMATMTFGVQTSRPTAAEASTANTEAMNAVTAKLKSLGVAEEDMQTSDYSIYQDFQYDSKGNRTDVSTFTVSMNVTIKLYDMAKIGDVIDGAVAAGANSSYGIYFGLKDPNAKRAELMKEAVSDAQTKAEAMAEAAGMKLGKLVTLTDGSSSGDNVLYRTRTTPAEEAGATSGSTAEKSAADIQPGTLDLNASITARYIIE